jgi:alkaline phosphatase D
LSGEGHGDCHSSPHLEDEARMEISSPPALTRRRFLGTLVAGTALGTGGITEILAQGIPPGVLTSEAARPQLPCGVMSGDVTGDRAIVWSRTDRAARMIVEYSVDESFRNAKRIVGPAALEHTDFTARLDLVGLPAGAQVFYRVMFLDLADAKTLSAPAQGRLRTPPAGRRAITFAFSGDEAGQGWGINREWGGYRLYEAMRSFNPDFFIHSGDQIYGDNPIASEVRLEDGTLWRNVVTPGKSKVAQTLDDYRQAFAYNLLDENKRRFAAEVPFLVQWDDHEVRNNWYPGQFFGAAEARYQVRSLSLLAARARAAMLEYNPFRFNPLDPEQVYRSFQYGPALDVFMLDERSYRGPNSPNRQAALDDDSAFLGSAQREWLKTALKSSRATWKLIASDMPISIVVPDLNPDVPKGTYEAWANADNGGPLGRELEIADLLSFIKANAIKNVVWVTADVHYASATYYDPARARFTDFKPFWEFVGGPINAGTFGPGEIDQTFGPDVRFVSLPQGIKQNRPPTEGMQYFGIGKIDGATQELAVSLHDLSGKKLWGVTLQPEA